MHCTTPTLQGSPSARALSARAQVTAKSATAGYSMGAYSRLVPSMRTAPVATTTSPLFTSSRMPPQVPTRRKVCTPIWCSSSMAMAAEGPPMPVDTTLTRSPSSKPVQVVNSRLLWTNVPSSK